MQPSERVCSKKYMENNGNEYKCILLIALTSHIERRQNRKSVLWSSNTSTPTCVLEWRRNNPNYPYSLRFHSSILFMYTWINAVWVNGSSVAFYTCLPGSLSWRVKSRKRVPHWAFYSKIITTLKSSDENRCKDALWWSTFFLHTWDSPVQFSAPCRPVSILHSPGHYLLTACIQKVFITAPKSGDLPVSGSAGLSEGVSCAAFWDQEIKTEFLCKQSNKHFLSQGLISPE